ncbi:hypothetical protein AWC38_SpisGene23215 [Stylophora pistillata]|uniref:Uncharacterized protein n=1 Tax=Stylophora pistillata TaxID=50429 RepID=A0A2B4R7H8_STYPI|nr:hypothetical protein AWC38_SpisGene23215 [Stylophora pistillata]
MRLSSLKSITRDNVIFEDAVVNQHHNERINIKVNVFNAGTVGENIAKPLVIASPFRFSFGVQPSMNKRGDVVGYTLPTPLWNNKADGSGEPTQKEFAFYEALKELKHICYQYLDDVYGTDVAESIKFPLVEKEGKAPVLYPKLMYSQKSGRIRTLFHSKEESKVDPLECLDYCKVKMSIVVDSIYLGLDYASVQLKVNDVYVHRLPQTQVQPLAVLEEDELEDEELEDGLRETYNKKGEHVGYHFLFPLHSPFSEWGLQKEADFLSALKELRSLCYERVEEVFSTEMAKELEFPMSKDCFLYPKLMYNKDTKEIRTLFYTRDEDEVEEEVEDPLFYLGKRCRVKMAIVIDCILVDETDNVASVQLKVNDVYVEPPLDRVNRLTYLSDDEEEYGVEATEPYWQTSTVSGRCMALVNNLILPDTSGQSIKSLQTKNKLDSCQKEKLIGCNDIPILGDIF